ncbi:hypothetical protein [Synechococcus sp. PCC 7336]|uniref:hypothetical protein n=1 Tax=Synechococcus sp. PCC 7336 TaxID=195250 RepID=UPI00034D9109|nr:hypothetical protein [Synechococcus sp. PCC 7336]
MSIFRAIRPIATSGLAAAIAIGSATFFASVEPARADILERLQMLEAAGTSRNGIQAADFNLAVLDSLIESMMEMAEVSLLGTTSEDPEIAAMSEAMLSMVEEELEHLQEMRQTRFQERIESLRNVTN